MICFAWAENSLPETISGQRNPRIGKRSHVGGES